MAAAGPAVAGEGAVSVPDTSDAVLPPDAHRLERRQAVKTITRFKTVKVTRTSWRTAWTTKRTTRTATTFVTRYLTRKTSTKWLTKTAWKTLPTTTTSTSVSLVFTTQTLSTTQTLTATTTTTLVALAANIGGPWAPVCSSFQANGRSCIDLVPCLAASSAASISLPPLTLDLSSSSVSLLQINLLPRTARPAQIIIDSLLSRTSGTALLYSDFDGNARWSLPLEGGIPTAWGRNATASFGRFLGLTMAAPGAPKRAGWIVEHQGGALVWQSIIVCVA
ncbi:hypothetical protein DFJ74DRAFT_709882 [Hyaloraphidium curvatum]|nr:hypothetical protein DFJ74DRAFT_709882 [Hyaloraphidium curvatum]